MKELYTDIRELAYKAITEYENGAIGYIELVEKLGDLGLNEEQIQMVLEYYEA